MKRRRFIQTLAVTPVAAMPLPAALNARQAAPRAQAEAPKYELSIPDAVAEPGSRFFTPEQYAALHKLSDLIMPPINGMPGAQQCGAPEFLDFLIGKSAVDRRQIYTTGLDTLNGVARKRFSKPFAELSDAQASELLSPLKKAWTYDPPTDPLSRFLRDAKHDVRTATLNSRDYINAASSGGRRGGGMGQYWFPLD